MEISKENIGHIVIHMLSFFVEKIICPASVWHPSLLARIFNYKLTISKSHGQTRLKPTRHGDEGFFFLQEWQTLVGFTLTIRSAVSQAQTMAKTAHFN